MPGIMDEPEYKAGEAELRRHKNRGGNPEWDDSEGGGDGGSGCSLSILAAIGVSMLGVAGAYIGVHHLLI